MELKSICCLCGLIILITSCYSAPDSKTYFTGAVFEHARQEDGLSTGVQTNLGYYQRAAKLAKKQGADLIVFPEYGLFPPLERDKIMKYLEVIPNPKDVRVVPCDESDPLRSPILHSLSCMAKKNGIVVVANMGGIEPCLGESSCPEDGELHLNANVAFDENGTVVGRFYKEHLFFELGMDLPREKQDPIFETKFGKFGMFICFEIIFRKMVDVSQLSDIDAILFSTMWLNSSPLFTSTPWFEAWAMGNNATLLAANINIPGYAAAGSGIYSGREGSIVSTLNPDGISKLVVATIPKRNHEIASTSRITAVTKNGTEPRNGDGIELPRVCSYDILNKAKDIYKDYRCLIEDVSNYTITKLINTSDHLEVCNNGVCCELEYTASSMNENFYLGVYNGTHIPYFRYFWSEENCFLARCDEFNGTACSNFPMRSSTLFKKVVMRATFTSQHVYPSLAQSNMRLVPVKEWTYIRKLNKPSIEFESRSGTPLLAVTLKGRAYDRDPPYIR